MPGTGRGLESEVGGAQLCECESGLVGGTDRAERSVWTHRPPASPRLSASSPWASCCASRPTSPAARPPRSKEGKSRHPPSGPASQGRLGARALLCRRGEAAWARNRRQTGPLYRPCRRLGHGRPKYRAPRVWQWVRAAPCAAGPSARSELPIYAKRPGKPAWAQGRGWAARVLCIRKLRLPCGLPLWEARRGACVWGEAEPGDVGDMRRAGPGMRGEPARRAAAVGGGSPAVRKRA